MRIAARRAGGGRPDHYYWFTALLAARGVRALACRAIAALIVVLGVLPAALLDTPAGPRDGDSRLAVIGIALCSAAMAASFLGPDWPSRTRSLACLAAGTACAATALVTVAVPVAQILSLAGFAALAGYTVCFHTTRLLAWTWTVEALAVGVAVTRIARHDAALAAYTVVAVVVINIVVVVGCRAVIRLIRPEAHIGDVEPLTGLAHRAAFDRQAVTLLASRNRRDDLYFVVVSVSIDSFSLLVDMAGVAGEHRARVALAEALRETVRHDAVLAHVAADQFLIADTFTTAEPTPLIERIRGAIAATPPHLSASLGVVSTPLRPLDGYHPEAVITRLVDIAADAMHTVRGAGGNDARHVIVPTLLIGDDDTA